MERSLLLNDISDIIKLGQNVIDHVGDCANLEQKVNVNNKLWMDVEKRKGWTLQKERLTNKARIVDDKGIQRGNGSLPVMREKMERLLSDDFLKPGDVIGVSRGAYEHYAIYAGNKKVIHYAGAGTDFEGNVCIHEAPFDEFINNSKSYFVVSFEGEYPVKIQSSTKFIKNGTFDYFGRKKYSTYSAEETLKRAYSRLGEARYSLVKNNCEHFAMWCKTGESESTQVRQIVRYVIAAGIALNGIDENKDDIMRYLAEWKGEILDDYSSGV